MISLTVVWTFMLFFSSFFRRFSKPLLRVSFGCSFFDGFFLLQHIRFWLYHSTFFGQWAFFAILLPFIPHTLSWKRITFHSVFICILSQNDLHNSGRTQLKSGQRFNSCNITNLHDNKQCLRGTAGLWFAVFPSHKNVKQMQLIVHVETL